MCRKSCSMVMRDPVSFRYHGRISETVASKRRLPLVTCISTNAAVNCLEMEAIPNFV